MGRLYANMSIICTARAAVGGALLVAYVGNTAGFRTKSFGYAGDYVVVRYLPVPNRVYTCTSQHKKV